jgi:ubiquinone/menaquinone biosynthesis C-methylase UbiE
MSIENAYKAWSEQYDTNENKTRDLEALSLIETLSNIQFDTCLEIGCGTGKNTIWLEKNAKQITAVDLTKEMMDKAKEKVKSQNVEFIIADITKEWSFAKGLYDLATFSLVLEHIENLEDIFSKLVKVIKVGGYVYVGELHPFKQYSGSKARFTTDAGEQYVTCFNNNISDFTNAARKFGFEITIVNEYFDDNDRTSVPRILTLLFCKKS